MDWACVRRGFKLATAFTGKSARHLYRHRQASDATWVRIHFLDDVSFGARKSDAITFGHDRNCCQHATGEGRSDQVSGRKGLMLIGKAYPI